MTHPRLYSRAAVTERHAAVAISSGGTVQGRIVACDLNGRVTLQTPNGWVTGRPVAADRPRSRSWLGGIFARA